MLCKHLQGTDDTSIYLLHFLENNRQLQKNQVKIKNQSLIILL